MNAIPTHYNGINFRSRLEAKWARFFDLLGWTYEYEPIDLDGYIPDFVLMFGKPTAVEIKPAFNEADLKSQALKAHAACVKAGMPILFLGATLLGKAWHTKGLGLIDTGGYNIEISDKNEEEQKVGHIELAEFCWCKFYKGYSIYTPEGSWDCLRCDGKCQAIDNKPYRTWDHVARKTPCEYWGRSWTNEEMAVRRLSPTPDSDFIQNSWLEATNLTQYNRIFIAGKG